MRSILHINLFKFSLKGVFFILCLTWSAGLLAQSQIEGVWKSSDNKYMMKISSLGDEYHGRVVWLANSQALDTKNPDEKLSKLPIKGSKILEELNYSSDEGKWVGGTLYIPSEGKHYDCEALVNGKTLQIKYSNKTWTWNKQ